MSTGEREALESLVDGGSEAEIEKFVQGTNPNRFVARRAIEDASPEVQAGSAAELCAGKPALR